MTSSLIDVTPGCNGFRVWVDGRVTCELATLSNAARAAAAFRELESVGALRPAVDLVRAQLEASIRSQGAGSAEQASRRG